MERLNQWLTVASVVARLVQLIAAALAGALTDALLFDGALGVELAQQAAGLLASLSRSSDPVQGLLLLPYNWA